MYSGMPQNVPQTLLIPPFELQSSLWVCLTPPSGLSLLLSNLLALKMLSQASAQYTMVLHGTMQTNCMHYLGTI